MRRPQKRKDNEMMADLGLGTVSGADGAIYRGEDLGGKRDWWWMGDMLSSVTVSVLRCLRDIQWNIFIKQFNILGLEHMHELWAGQRSRPWEMVFYARKWMREPRRVRIDSWGHHCLNDVWRKRISQQRLFRQSDILWDMFVSSPVPPFQGPWVFYFVLFFLESVWLHPCRKSTLWATPPKNLGSCRKRHFTHILSSLPCEIFRPTLLSPEGEGGAMLHC